MENEKGDALHPEKKQKLAPVVDDFEMSISLWWKNLKKFLFIYWQGLRPAIIPIAILVVLYILKEQPTPSPFFESWSYIVLTTVAYLFVIYFYIRAQIATFLFIRDGYKDKPEKVFKDSKSLFWPYIGLSLLTAILVFLWLLLLIIPGIIFSVFYVFAVYVFFCEEKRGMDAIRRSRKLVSGYFWQIFGRILFIFLVTLIFVSIVGLPAYPLPKESVTFAIWDVVMQVINLIVAPIYIIFFFKLYRDLISIKK